MAAKCAPLVRVLRQLIVGHADIAAAADVDTFHGQSPARLLDTRPGSPTVDGQFAGIGAIASNGAVNVTILGLGADGKVSIFNGSGGTIDVITDVLGWFPVGAGFSGLTPARLLDTRPGLDTIDGLFEGGGTVGEASTRNLLVTGRGGVPAANVGAVALNVTVTDPTKPGYLTIYPQGALRPTASNLNFVAGQTIANMVIVPVGSSGQISIFNASGDSHVIVDVLGWFPNPTDPPTVYGNNLKLKSNGIGTALFASTPNTAINLLTTHFGGPVSDEVESFPQALGGGLFLNPDLARLFSYRLARSVCFIDYLCLVFGGSNSSSLTFVGYVYQGAALTDVNGLGNGARGSDFPGAIVTIDDGPRCFNIGTGRSKSGINLTLWSHGPYYYDPNTGARATPSLDEVEVISMYAGAFPDFAFECYPDDY